MVHCKTPYRIALFAAALLSLTAGISYAVEDDFGPAKTIEGKYFTIYYSPQIDASTLAPQLNIQPADEIIAGKSPQKESPTGSELADMADTLFLQVSDILDMHLYSFQGKIKICADDAQIERIYGTLFNASLHHRKSFYVYALNTIYISLDNFKREILGHEMAHAIINHYFVVQSPVKIQEILSMYVEYQLRK
jgi:hypothetical protein